MYDFVTGDYHDRGSRAYLHTETYNLLRARYKHANNNV